MRPRIAVMTGTLLTPGVSKNGRLYNETNISKAFQRLKERVTGGDRPVTMMTHHAAEDDSTAIVARITKVSLDGGQITYEADVADTEAGRDIVALTSPDQPYLRNVSIRGRWVGVPRYEAMGDRDVETADDLEIDGVDFTKSPGVVGAVISSVKLSESSYEGGMIMESATAEVKTEDAATAEASVFADPGYKKDGLKRFPLDTNEHIYAAWAHLSIRENAKGYSQAQFKRMKGKINAAAGKSGITLETDQAARYLAWHVLNESAPADLAEGYFSATADNGPASVSVSLYGVAPADLPAAALLGAGVVAAGMAALDQDEDGDVDGIPSLDNDPDAPAISGVVLMSDTDESTASTSTETTLGSVKEGSTSVSDETATAETEATETAPEEAAETPALSEAQTESVRTIVAEQMADLKDSLLTSIKDLLPTKEAAAETAESAATGEVTEAVAETAEVAESTDLTETITETVKGIADGLREALETTVAQLRSDIVEAYGPPKRKGFVLVETAEGAEKPFSQMTKEEFDAAAARRADDILPGYPPTALVVG